MQPSIKNTYVLILFGFTVLFEGCERELVITPPEELTKELVSNCIFTNEGPFEIEITTPYFLFGRPTIEAVTNAQVEISSTASGTSTARYIHGKGAELGKYISSTLPMEGQTYTLTVSNRDFPTIRAVSTLPKRVEFGSGSVRKIRGTNDQALPVLYQFSIQIKDLTNTKDYYYLTISSQIYQTDSITGEKAFYARQYAEIAMDNFEYFTPYLKNGLLFSDEAIDHTTGMISGRTATYKIAYGDFEEAPNLSKDSTQLVFRLHHLSKELFLFYQSHAAKLSADGIPNAGPTSVYSNIKAGHGIFGGAFITQQFIPIQ